MTLVKANVLHSLIIGDFCSNTFFVIIVECKYIGVFYTLLL